MHQIYTQINNLKLLIKHVYVSGPPFIFDEDDIVKTLGHILSCKKLENFSNEAMLEKVGSWGITEIRELVHVLTLRKKDQEAS
jgi:hypothetical protein